MSPGNQESFATRPTTSNLTEAEHAEYLASLEALMQDEIVEIDAIEKKNIKLHYNSEQNLINLPAIVGCLNWIALRTRPDIAWGGGQQVEQQVLSLMIQTLGSFVSSIFVNIYIILWAMHCDVFQYLLSLSITCEYWPLGDAASAPTGEKSQQGLIVYHGIHLEALQKVRTCAIVVAEMTSKSCEIEVSSDNAASLHMVRNGSETAWRTSHISVKALWLHQMARRGIKFTYQPTTEMAADSLTKGLGASRLPQIREDLCLIED